jgi:hypothetical protein
MVAPHPATHRQVMARASPGGSEGPKLLDRLRAALRSRHYSDRTEQAYLLRTRRFVRFCGTRHPSVLGESEVNAFLTHLAEVGK